MKRLPIFLMLILSGVLLMGADGCSSDPNVEGAKLDLRNKDYDRALENVNTAIQNNPENAAAYELKGQILQEQAFSVQDVEQHTQLIRQMVEAYNRAVELDPGLQDAVDQRLRLAYYNEFQRGGQAFNRGRENDAEYNTAVQYFQNAAFIQPDSSGAYVNTAYSLLNAGRQDEAVAPFEKAIELGDSQPDTYIFLADLYRTADQSAKAVTLLEQAQRQFPENEDIQAQLLNAYILAGQTDRALQSYREQVERQPDNKLYRYNYGSLLLQAERYDEAIEHLQRAVELDPNYASAYYNLGASYVNKAVNVNERINELDDQLRAQRAQLNDAQIREREAELERLAEERRQYFSQAVQPLERALDMMRTEGQDATGVCQALFQAYVQTGSSDKAEQVSECAGYGDVN